MIVTTSSRPDDQLIQTAMEIAFELNGSYVKRSKQAVEYLKKNYRDNTLVVGKSRLELHFLDQNNPLFFHPNSAMFRIKRLLKGEKDPFSEACNLQVGDSFLDCTLGLASDSIVASYIVGKEGIVKGIEESSSLAYIVKTGLQQWETGLEVLDNAMKRIDVSSNDHLTFLRGCPNNSYDVIYFDPMFEETIEESIGILPLKSIANFTPLKKEAINEAKRVAKRRIVLKDHWRSTRFEENGFIVNIRKSAKFHYGVIEISD
ncbi:class I SAM-dependent methyltransferase [Metabacillus sp. FJAT-53654]|uniref:Class I SAM-dependent methyltransferase n=1 Tax=Metabacillus rhizosphaerae TaxID=3117747 RepID=A0ABZ2N0W4_9BACI